MTGYEILTRATNHLWHWFSYINANDVETYKSVCEATTVLNNCICLLMREDAKRLEAACDAFDAARKEVEIYEGRGHDVL